MTHIIRKNNYTELAFFLHSAGYPRHDPLTTFLCYILVGENKGSLCILLFAEGTCSAFVRFVNISARIISWAWLLYHSKNYSCCNFLSDLSELCCHNDNIKESPFPVYLSHYQHTWNALKHKVCHDCF